MGPIEWEEFKRTFLNWFFPLELREVKIKEFINLRPAKMNVGKFTKLSKYAPFMVVEPRLRMSNCISSVSSLVSKESKIAMLVKEINISRLMKYAE